MTDTRLEDAKASIPKRSKALERMFAIARKGDRKMLMKLNALLDRPGVTIGFEDDVARLRDQLW